MIKTLLSRRAPLWGALLAAAPVAVVCVMAVLDAAARGRHTAQATTMAFGLAATLFFAYVGGTTAALVRRELEAGARPKAAVFGLVGLGMVVWFCGAAALNRAEERRLDAIRSQPLTVEQARNWAGGTRDEAAAVAWNPSCPPEVLRALARHPDRVVRSSAAYNPSLPADAAEALLKDPEDSVRSYARWGVERRAAAARAPAQRLDQTAE